MSAARVVVVGAVNIDFVITAPHLPAAGETVVGDRLTTFGGGKGANAAVAASRAGAEVTLVGAVGSDEWGANALAALRSDGVDTSGVATLQGESTGAALIVVDERGENQIALGPGANGAVSAAHVRAALGDALTAAEVVLVSSEIPFDAVAAAVEAASKANVTCILNPAPVIAGLDTLLALSPIVTPNEIELAELVRGLGEPAAHESGDRIIGCLRLVGGRTKVPAVATLGGEGCIVCLPGGATHRVPAHPAAHVVDTTGAGDTFNGVLAARLAGGDDVMSAVRLAVVAASLSVGASGARAGMPTAAAILAEMRGSEGRARNEAGSS